MASSSVNPPKEKYDVFINFRGHDTRQTFTSHLHAALIQRKVETYIDYRLERGDVIESTLLKAIEESKISVIIFSKDYASSAWCLDELVHILECRENHGQHVIPIFYEIEPSQVRHQLGSYETALARHETEHKVAKWKVAKWKEALEKAAGLSGSVSTSKKFRDDSDFVEQVVRDVLAKFNRKSSSYLTGLVGAEDRIKKILLKLDLVPEGAEDVRVRFVVIWGMGGIGKTTLAESVYHRESSKFDAHYFLLDVGKQSGEKGCFSPELHRLRDKLLGELLGDRSLDIPTQAICDAYKARLHQTKVLVVLDDVNDSSQLKFLAREVPFGQGSRIIITTRDMEPVKETLLADRRDVEIYEVEELNDDESLQLFHLDAPTQCAANSEILEQVLDHAAGIPLALTTLRLLFLRCQSKEKQEEMWEKLKKCPSEKLQKVYRASYEGLESNEREIFLDIACFHNREKLCDAKRMLAACLLSPDIGIDILIDRSLISIKDNCIWMHNVIQEMGWEIVRENSPQELGKRSRLHNGEDVCEVLKRNMGTDYVQSISSSNCFNTPVLDPQAFTGMHKLRFLKLRFIQLDYGANLEDLPDALQYLYWDSYPLKSLPSKFSPDNLVQLHMPKSKLERLWKKGQNPKNLKRIDLSYSMDLADVGELSNSVYFESINLQRCKSLAQVPDLSKCVYIESINLQGCVSLVQVPSYFQKFTNLTYLNLGHCSEISVLPNIPSKMEFLDLSGTALEELPPSIWSLEKLVNLNLKGCRSIKNFSSSPWKMKSLKYLSLSETQIEMVPSSSFMCLTGIISLDLSYCHRLVSLPTDICELKSLERLDLSRCSSFTNFPEIEKPMEHLQYLNLSGTKIEELPSSVGNLVGLKKLDLTDCTNLELRPNNFYNLNLLEWFSLGGCVELKILPLSFILCSLVNLNLGGCKWLEEIPDCFTSFPALQKLDLTRTMIETVPPSIKQVSRLKHLFLNGCECLQSLPVLPCLLEELVAEGCTRLETVSVSVTAQTQGLEQILSGKRMEILRFNGCDNLGKNSRSNIMDDAHFRIMRMATACNLERLSSGKVEFVCPGNEIPKWFSYRTEGSSMNIKLPPHWSDDSNFLGIALCSVFAFSGNCHYLEPRCKMILKTNYGETQTTNLVSTGGYGTDDPTAETEHVLVWYYTVHVISDEAKLSTEAFFDFYTERNRKGLNKVKRCGVCLLYAQGQVDDALKFEVIRPQQLSGESDCGSGESDWWGSSQHVCRSELSPFFLIFFFVVLWAWWCKYLRVSMIGEGVSMIAAKVVRMIGEVNILILLFFSYSFLLFFSFGGANI